MITTMPPMTMWRFSVSKATRCPQPSQPLSFHPMGAPQVLQRKGFIFIVKLLLVSISVSDDTISHTDGFVTKMSKIAVLVSKSVFQFLTNMV